MKVGIIGSGNVGQAIAKGLLENGHEVWLSTREPEGDKATKLRSELSGVQVTDFATAAKEGEFIIFAVTWSGAEAAVKAAGQENLIGKVVIDTSNVIAREGDMMVYGGQGKSAAEQVQAWLPDSKVVKAFNSVGADMMYKPPFSTKPTMFIAGDDADAKRQTPVSSSPAASWKQWRWSGSATVWPTAASMLSKCSSISSI
jgi:predicted dinucleotide-binding enzyme